MLAKYSLQKDCYHYTMILPSGILLVGLYNPHIASEKTKKLQSQMRLETGGIY